MALASVRGAKSRSRVITRQVHKSVLALSNPKGIRELHYEEL